MLTQLFSDVIVRPLGFGLGEIRDRDRRGLHRARVRRPQAVRNRDTRMGETGLLDCRCRACRDRGNSDRLDDLA